MPIFSGLNLNGGEVLSKALAFQETERKNEGDNLVIGSKKYKKQ